MFISHMSKYLTHISDTARWVAVLRGQESARRDRLFNDHLAFKIAGIEGAAIAGMMKLLSSCTTASVPVVLMKSAMSERTL